MTDMQKASAYHREAMEAIDQALESKRRGDLDAEKRFKAHALEKEILAAFLCDQEPSRSILIRSAASIAFILGSRDQAAELAKQGITNFTPLEIKKELEEIIEKCSVVS